MARQHHAVGGRIQLGIATGAGVQPVQRAQQVGHAQAGGLHPLGAGVLGLHTRVQVEAADQLDRLLAAPVQPPVAREGLGKGGQFAPLAGRVGAEHAVAVLDGRQVVGADHAPQLGDAVARLRHLVEAAIGHDRAVGPVAVGKGRVAHLRHRVGGGGDLVVHQAQRVAHLVGDDVAQQRARLLGRQRQPGRAGVHAGAANRRPVVLAEAVDHLRARPGCGPTAFRPSAGR